MWGTTVLFLSPIWTLLLATSHFHVVAAATDAPKFLPQGFFFDWNPPGTTVPIPVTQQCETLHITWERGSAAEGPNPTSPYFLQIFTSVYVVPFVIPAGSGTSLDFQVPFSPGTQYQICMIDSRGVSGGCQDMYTVIPNSSATAQNPATCKNVTFPVPLQVDAAVINGAFSQYGWIPQCTDLQVQAKNGTGPYTLTVAPTLHTPLNITSNGDPINWTVSLSHGIPFFISVTDSQGSSWSQGPLHSGDNDDTACLNINHSPDGHSSSSSIIPAAVGAGIGGIVVGLLAGAFGIIAFRRRRGSRRPNKHQEDLLRDSQLSSNNSQSPREVPATGGTISMAGGGGLEYIVEPFAMPSTMNSSSSDPSVPLLPGGNMTSPTTALTPDAHSASGSSDPVDPAGRRTNVYVVHHDGGRAPVTVYTEEGAEVVELPPRYQGSSTSAPSESETSRETHRRRRDPGATPRKTRGPRSPI